MSLQVTHSLSGGDQAELEQYYAFFLSMNAPHWQHEVGQHVNPHLPLSVLCRKAYMEVEDDDPFLPRPDNSSPSYYRYGSLPTSRPVSMHDDTYTAALPNTAAAAAPVVMPSAPP